MERLQPIERNQRLRRHRHGRSSSLSASHDWPEQDESTSSSLPYTTRPRHIQTIDGRRDHAEQSFSRGQRSSEDMPVHQAVTPAARRGRAATVHRRRRRSPTEYSDEDDESYERRSRSRVRRKYRSRSRSRPRSRSASTDSADSELRAARAAYHSTPESRRSSRSPSTERSPSVESASSVSERGERRRPRREIEDEVEVERDREPSVHRRHRRNHRDKEPVVYEKRAVHSPKYDTPKDDKPRRRARDHEESRSSSRRTTRHRDVRYDTRPPPSAKRSSKRYYESDSVYAERPQPRRSHKASGSQRSSSRSVSSSRRSGRLGSFLRLPPAHAEHADKPKYVQCVVCLDEEIPASKAADLRCGHRMCRSCLRQLFRLSLKDPQQMPPKCCGEKPIPLRFVNDLFNNEFKRAWNSKFAEFSTRNRIYCPSRRCGEWIKPDRIRKLKDGRKYAKCSNCKTEICCVCNGKWHKSRECPKDEATSEILRQAKENGWQRCFSCKSLVELKEGCNHMTCRCGAEFCMICGAKWKTCECPWFNYDTIDTDRLDDMQIPVDAGIGRGRLVRTIYTADSRMRPRPQSYDDEVAARQLQEQRDEDLARRLQYVDIDEEDDNYMASVAREVVATSSSAVPFRGDEYRRPPPTEIPPPVPPAPVPGPFDAPTSPPADYVSGVSRARGVPRATSMERRLAERFSDQRPAPSPPQLRPFGSPYGQAIPPPPVPPMAMGPPPVAVPPPPQVTRRHTLGEPTYEEEQAARLSERLAPRRNRSTYEFDSASLPDSRRWHVGRGRDAASYKDSQLAGLSGLGRGMNRVYEWANHVEPVAPDMDTTRTHRSR